MKITLIGGSGFVGTRLIDLLCENGSYGLQNIDKRQSHFFPEVTRDEGMLQEVLDVVSGNLERLEVSAESVKLLSYCYYYVEEEECAVLARRMLEELKQVGDRDVKMAERVYRELVGGKGLRVKD